MFLSHLLNLFLFLFYLYGFGYLCTYSIKKFSLENIVLRLGVGLGFFPVLGITMNLLGIPLDWRIFLSVAAIGILLQIKDRRNLSKFSLDRSERWTLFFLLFLLIFCVVIYVGGPFVYDWLEDDDPWMHAAGIEYIATEKNLNAASGIFHYLNPYPPGYDLIFAVLHQTHPSLYWTLKFFNGVIISLCYLFFYFFAFEFTRDRLRALGATFVLLTLPCFLSHFIWAHSLVITLFFPAFYAFFKSLDDRRYMFPAVVLTTGIFLTQPTQSIKFCLLVFLWLIAKLLVRKRFFMRITGIIAAAGLLSLTWWGPVISETLKGRSEMRLRDPKPFTERMMKTDSFLKMMFDPENGSATRGYTFKDYFNVEKENYINNPIGIGEAYTLLGFLGIPFLFIFYRKGEDADKEYALTAIFWLIFTFFGMNSMSFQLPVGLFAFRFWMLFAIPFSFLALEAILGISNFFRKDYLRVVVILILILCIFVTAAYDKYYLNTDVWSWGVHWPHKKEVLGYSWMRKNLKPGTKIFAYTDNHFVIGFDMHADYWSADYQAAFQNAIHQPLDTLYAGLKKNRFEYLVVGRRDGVKFGFDFINEKVLQINEHPSFEYVTDTHGLIALFKIL